MISKLIVWGEDRNQAMERLHNALDDYHVIGLPTNIKFMKRVLRNETFRDGVFDTSFIAQNENTLLGNPELSKEEHQKLLASVALTNLWFDTEAPRFRRKSAVDPWATLDNFRINHKALKEFKLVETQGDSEKVHKLKIEFLSEKKFNVHVDADDLGVKTNVILENAEIIENQEKENELIIRTSTEQFKIPYLKDDDNKVYCLDQEGAPLKIVRYIINSQHIFRLNKKRN